MCTIIFGYFFTGDGPESSTISAKQYDAYAKKSTNVNSYAGNDFIFTAL